jgi:hypothetical protein
MSNKKAYESLKLWRQNHPGVPLKSATRIKFDAVVTSLEAGRFYSFAEIEELVGLKLVGSRGDRTREIAMNRAKLTAALRAGGRPWITRNGVGIEMAGPENGVSMIGEKVVAAASSVHRAHSFSQAISDIHYNSMTDANKSRMQTIESAFDSFRSVAKQVLLRLTEKL